MQMIAAQKKIWYDIKSKGAQYISYSVLFDIVRNNTINELEDLSMKAEEQKKQEQLKSKNSNKNAAVSQELSETWAADAQDDLEEWIEEQGIQLRY